MQKRGKQGPFVPPPRFWSPSMVLSCPFLLQFLPYPSSPPVYPPLTPPDPVVFGSARRGSGQGQRLRRKPSAQ